MFNYIIEPWIIREECSDYLVKALVYYKRPAKHFLDYFDFLVLGFLAAGFLAAGFLAAGFLAAGFLAAGFLAAGFLFKIIRLIKL